MGGWAVRQQGGSRTGGGEPCKRVEWAPCRQAGPRAPAGVGWGGKLKIIDFPAEEGTAAGVSASMGGKKTKRKNPERARCE